MGLIEQKMDGNIARDIKNGVMITEIKIESLISEMDGALPIILKH